MFGVLILCHPGDWEDDSSPTSGLAFDYFKAFPCKLLFVPVRLKGRRHSISGREDLFAFCMWTREHVAQIATGMMKHALRMVEQEVKWTWVCDNIILDTYYTEKSPPGFFLITDKFLIVYATPNWYICLYSSRPSSNLNFTSSGLDLSSNPYCTVLCNHLLVCLTSPQNSVFLSQSLQYVAQCLVHYRYSVSELLGWNDNMKKCFENNF